MEAQMETGPVQPPRKIVSVNPCVHGRLIEEVLTEDGQRSGKVRCLECGTQFDIRERTK